MLRMLKSFTPTISIASKNDFSFFFDRLFTRWQKISISVQFPFLVPCKIDTRERKDGRRKAERRLIPTTSCLYLSNHG